MASWPIKDFVNYHLAHLLLPAKQTYLKHGNRDIFKDKKKKKEKPHCVLFVVFVFLFVFYSNTELIYTLKICLSQQLFHCERGQEKAHRLILAEGHLCS